MTQRAAAQETFAPLISENCVAFIHVDFRNLDIDAVRAALQKAGEDFLREFGFDEASASAVAHDLDLELERMLRINRPTWRAIMEELGIQEVAVIVDLELLDFGGHVIAIPWTNRTDVQVRTLRSWLQRSSEDVILEIDGFLLVANRWFAEEVAEWATSITPAPANAPIHEALQSVAGADIKVVATIPDEFWASASAALHR